MKDLLSQCQGDHPVSPDSKILRCKRPFWVCPGPFEAFVCNTEDDAFEFIEMADAWSIKRDFRLYKLDRTQRWEGQYYGILFSIRPVPRQRHIELERLIDPQLLSCTLSGIAEEIRAPVTIYAASSYLSPDGTEVAWLPIESYQPRKRFVPPRYNPICELLRGEALSPVLNEFHNITQENCPQELGCKGACGGRLCVPCLSREWNHCPAFLMERRKRGLCYSHDMEMIDRLIQTWGEDTRCPQPIQESCWAGFTEVAIPIVVHDLLVGVAMTGQFVIDPDEVALGDNIVDRLPGLDYSREKLERFIEVARGRAPRDDDERRLADFVVSTEDVDEKVDVIVNHGKQLAQTATARYRDLRLRSESLFKQELLGRINDGADEPAAIDEKLLELLGRMREYWGFEAVYLLLSPKEEPRVHAIAFSGTTTETYFGFNTKAAGRIEQDYRQDYPSPLIIDFSKLRTPTGKYAKDLQTVLMNARMDPDLCLPTDGRFYFCALVPMRQCLAGLVFAGRQQGAVSPLKHRVEGGISDLCQEVIFDTSIQIIRRLEEVYGPYLGVPVPGAASA